MAAVAGLLAAATEPASAFQPSGVALRAPGMRCVVQCSANRAACHAALPCASFSDSGPSPLPAARRFCLLPTTIRARGACTQRCALARYAGDAHSMSWQRLRRGVAGNQKMYARCVERRIRSALERQGAARGHGNI